MKTFNVKTACISFILVILLSTIALIGWLTGNLTLAGMGDQIIPMAPFTIACFLLISLSALFLKQGFHLPWLINSMLFFCAAIVISVWIENLTGYSFDVEHLFVRKANLQSGYPIGRMSPVTSIFFSDAIISLLFVRIKKYTRWLIWASIFLFFAALIFCIGYLFKTPLLYKNSIIPPAWNTSLSFVLLYFGLLVGFANSEKPVSLFIGETIRARLLRRFLPVTLLIIFLSGWANISLHAVYDNHVLTNTLVTIISLLALMLIILYQSKSIGKEIDHYLLFKTLVQQELNEKETHFKTLADSGQTMIWTCTEDKKCDYINLPGLQFKGRSLEDELKNGWFEGVHADDQENVSKIFNQAFESRSRYSIDYRLLSSDGSYRWVQENGTPRFNFNNAFIGYIGHCIDITQRKEDEGLLKISEHRYRELLEKINLIAVILDTNGNTVFCNEHTLKTTGYSKDELIGKNWFDMMLPAEIIDVRKIFIDGLMKGKIEERFENPIQTKSGKQKFIKWSNVIQRNIDNEITGIAGIGEDITEQKKAEAAIKVKDSLISLTGKMAKVGGWEFDVKSGKGTWTDEVALIHGLDPNTETSKLIGLSFYEREHRNKVEAAIEKAIKQQVPYDLELKMTDVNGVQKWVRTIGIPVVVEGVTTKLQGTFQDITEIKKTEESLQKLNQELEQRVQNRTIELEQKNADLERMNKLFVGRELRMIELKNEIDDLKSKLLNK